MKPATSQPAPNTNNNQNARHSHNIHIESHPYYQSYNRFLRWEPFLRSEKLMLSWAEFFKYYGFEIILFMSVLIAFGENNIYSLIILLICGVFAIFSYLIHDETQYNESALNTLQFFWRIFFSLLGLEIVR